MTYLALPWFVLVTTGSPSKMSLVLAAEILPMAILGIPSGALVQRLGSRTTMLVADFARAPILASIPLLYAAGVLSFGSCSRSSRCSAASCRRTSQSQRTILPELVGEDETRMSQANSSIEGGTALRRARSARRSPARSSRSSARRTCCTSTLRPTSSRSSSSSAFVPRAEGGRPRRPSTACSPGLRFLVSDKLLGPLAATVVVFGFLAAGMSAGLPVYAYDEFDGSSWIAGLFYAALGAGARRRERRSPSSS